MCLPEWFPPVEEQEADKHVPAPTGYGGQAGSVTPDFQVIDRTFPKALQACRVSIPTAVDYLKINRHVNRTRGQGSRENVFHPQLYELLVHWNSLVIRCLESLHWIIISQKYLGKSSNQFCNFLFWGDVSLEEENCNLVLCFPLQHDKDLTLLAFHYHWKCTLDRPKVNLPHTDWEFVKSQDHYTVQNYTRSHKQSFCKFVTWRVNCTHGGLWLPFFLVRG